MIRSGNGKLVPICFQCMCFGQAAYLLCSPGCRVVRGPEETHVPVQHARPRRLSVPRQHKHKQAEVHPAGQPSLEDFCDFCAQ